MALKWRILLSIAAIVLTLRISVCPAENRIANPGFESGEKTPQAWKADGAGAVWLDDGAHSGKKCICLKGGGTNIPKWESDDIPLTPGVRYVLSAWLKTQGVRHKHGWVWLTTFDKGGKYRRDYFLCKPDGTAGWFERSRCFTPGEGEVLARVSMALRGNGKMCVDNLVLRKARVWVDENAALHIKGKPFFPIGLYTGPCDTRPFEEIRQAGFNSILPYSLGALSTEEAREYLDEARRKNIHVAFSIKDYLTPYRLSDTNTWIPRENVVDFVTSLRNHPALLTWYIGDEPAPQGVSVGDLIQTQNLVKQIDAEHPTSIALCRPELFDYYGRYVDVLMPDIYPVPHHPLKEIERVVRKARAACAPSQPVWAVLQAFESAAFAAAPPQKTSRAPTYEEMRCMTFLAVANGAKGVFYFTYDSSRFKIYHHPDLWADLKKIAGELKNLTPILLAPAETLNFKVQPAEKLSVATRFLDNKAYLIVVNKENSPAEVVADSDGATRLREVRILGSNKEIPVQENGFRETVEPYGVRIYQLDF